MNGYVRFKWGLTETAPAIKPYLEKEWAKLSDVTNVPVQVSITLLRALHIRWVSLLRDMEPDDWKRLLVFPQQDLTMELWQVLAKYAWHTKHHFEHIARLKERMEWV